MSIADDALRQARLDLAAFPRAAAIRVGDDDGLAEYLVSAPEKERRGVAGALSLVWTARSVLKGVDRDAAARRRLLIEVGTASPARNYFSPFLSPNTMGSTWLHPRTTEIFRARPLAVQQRFQRWWWDEPFMGRPHAWDLWRALVLEGSLPEPSGVTYARGALETARPWPPFDEAPELAAARRRAWLASDPPALDLVRRGYRAYGDLRWLEVSRLLALVSDGLLTVDDVVSTAVRVLASNAKTDVAAAQRKHVDALAVGPEAFEPYSGDLLTVLAHGRAADAAWALERLAAVDAAGARLDSARILAGLRSLVTQGSVDAVKSAISFAHARLAPDDLLEVLLTCLENPKAEQQVRAAKALSAADPATWSDATRARAASLAAEIAPRASAVLVTALGEGPEAGRGTVPSAERDKVVGERALPPAPAPRAAGVDPVVGAEDLVDLAVACIEGGADGIEVERLLDAISRFPRPDVIPREGIERIVHSFRVDHQREEIAVQTQLRTHVLLLAFRWATGLPVTLAPEVLAGLTAHRYSPRLRPGLHFPRSHVSDIALPPRVSSTEAARESWKDTSRSCQAWGPAGHVCARALEIHEDLRSRPQPLLSLPTTSLGELDPAAFAARLDRMAADGQRPRPFDGVAALLRLPEACEDSAVVRALAAMRSPLARTALAIWGEPVPGRIPSALQTIIDSRGRTVAHVHAAKTKEAKQFRSVPKLGTAVWAEFSTDPPRRPDMWDPIGAAAWLGSEDGLAGRSWEFLRQDDAPLGSPVSAPDVRAAFAASPAAADVTALACAAGWARVGLSERTSTVPDAPLLYLIDRAQPLGAGGHAYLALALASASSSARAVSRDMLAGGLWEPDQLADTVGIVGAIGRPSARRTAEILGDVGREPAAAQRVLEALGRIVIRLDAEDAELTPYLHAMELVSDPHGADRAPDDVVAALRRVADHGGSRATIARRILAERR